MGVKTTAVVLAAGQGKRMGTSTAKQYLLLKGRPVLYYSLKAFQDSPVDEIVVVTGTGEQDYVRREIVERYGVTKVRNVVEGGKERYHSVYRGLCAVEDTSRDMERYFLIHDGARPLVTPEIIQRALETVRREGACVVGMPVKDTIKLADRESYSRETPDRSLVWMVQTPQAFEGPLLKKAYSELIEREQELLEKGVRFTDDAGVVEYFTGRRVKLAEGSYENIKITTPGDLRIAEAFLDMQLLGCRTEKFEGVEAM